MNAWYRFIFCVWLILSLACDSYAAVFRVADLNPGIQGSYPSNMTAHASAVYFSGYTFNTGRELYKYNNTEITLAADVNPTADYLGPGLFEGNDSVPDWLTVYNDQLYFSAFEPRRGGELWRYDGSTASRVADISPDNNDVIKNSPNSSWPSELTVYNNALYFSANSGTAIENYELWKYDGTSVSRVANIHPDSGINYSSFPKYLLVLGENLFFVADDGVHGFELWKHNSTDTTLLDINPGGAESSSYPKYLTAFNGVLYFQATNSLTGYELWKSDGNSVTAAADINSGPEGSFPEYLTIFDGSLYFRATNSVHGSELWKYDGTEATLAADINPLGSSYPKNLTVYGNELVFAADDGVHGWELWKFSGGQASLIADLSTGGDSYPEEFTEFNGVLYFTATTPESGYEVWAYDGQTVTMLADINPGPGNSYPQFLTATGGLLLFRAAEDGASNWELWALRPDEPVENRPPAISLSSPQSGSIIIAGEPVTLNTETSDPDGAVVSVEFLNNGNSIGTDNTAPFELTLPNLSPGVHTFTGIATDDKGAKNTSTPLVIKIASKPQITSIQRDGASIVLQSSATPNLPHTLQASPDLTNWTDLETKTPTDHNISFSDAPSEKIRFYRVIIPNS